MKWITESGSQWISFKKNQVLIDARTMKRFGEPVLLHYLIREYGFSYIQAVMIYNSLKNQPGSQFYSTGHRLTCDREMILIDPVKKQGEKTWQISRGQRFLDTGEGDQFSLQVIKKLSGFNISPDVAFLNESLLRYPLIVRPPGRGDRFQPLGMKGKQKLSDLMINNKIPRNMKQNLRVITSGEDIVWVVGYRIHESYKIKEDTQRALMIEYHHEDKESI